jgi:hypothetical protein
MSMPGALVPPHVTQGHYPLDGISPAGCWSTRRYLRSAFAGEPCSRVGDAIAVLRDQSGGGRDLARRSAELLATADAGVVPSQITSRVGFIVASCLLDQLSEADLVRDEGAFFGLAVSAGEALAMNHDGEARVVRLPFLVGPCVLAWRHEDGQLRLEVAQGSLSREATIASGPTSALCGALLVSSRVVELAMFSVVPPEEQRTAIIADFLAEAQR